MYLKGIEISGYRNYYKNELIEFEDGINIIIGPNNSGKTNLLNLIRLLDSNEKIKFKVDDFNKNYVKNNIEKMRISPPVIKIKYQIQHKFNLDIHDDALLRLKEFIVYKENGKLINNKSLNGDQEENSEEYIIDAEIVLKYELDTKYYANYKDEIQSIDSYDQFIKKFRKFIDYYSWKFYNTVSEKSINSKTALNIFNVDYVPADRSSDRTLPLAKKYIKKEIADSGKKLEIQDEITDVMNKRLEQVKNNMTEKLLSDESEIGIKNGNTIISPNFLYESDLNNYFNYTLEDSKNKFKLPMSNNGLGYNNLIYIYNIIKFRIENDYNLLLIEEPEAHLHPAMQYKLFKYLNNIKEMNSDEKNNLSIRNQIFVTTHSPNISAASDLSNIISIKYHRDVDNNRHTVISDNYKKKFEKNEYYRHKKHLAKFLDVTRSDMLFTEKVILVEGLAEKLLFPKFAKKSGLDYDLINNHISIVEVGGIIFKYFLPIFDQTTNKVVCFRDNDYKYSKKDCNTMELKDIIEFKKYIDLFKSELEKEYIDNKNVRFKTQCNYGSTFENELFIENFEYGVELLKIVIPESLRRFINKKDKIINSSMIKKLSLCKSESIKVIHLNDIEDLSIEFWKENIDLIDHSGTRKKVRKILDIYFDKYNSIEKPESKEIIEKIFFANLFLSYCKKSKGAFALELLVDEDLVGKLKVPRYIEEGFEWLKK